MAEQEHERDYGRLTDHEYDGIREYDNPCPTWWHLIFLGTFLFSVVYFLFFTGSFGWTLAEAYNSAVAANLKLQFGEIGDLEANEKTLVEYMGNNKWLAVGATVFKANCSPCHGPDGAGLSAPNLTDDNYKHVKQLTDIPKVVKNGAAAGAMPAWKTLHQNEIVLVSAYVANLRGKNLSGLGDGIEQRDGNYKKIPPWPTAADLEQEPAQESEEATQTPPADADEPTPAGTPPSNETTLEQKAPPIEESAPKTDTDSEKPPAETSADEKPAELRTNPLRP